MFEIVYSIIFFIIDYIMQQILAEKDVAFWFKGCTKRIKSYTRGQMPKIDLTYKHILLHILIFFYKLMHS